jgi:hypothetical protein
VRAPTPLRLTLAVAGLSLAACKDGPAPTATRSAEAARPPARVESSESEQPPAWATLLQWNERRAEAALAVETIGAEGGSVELPQTGLVLTVPAGAVAAPTRFVVRSLPGHVVGYEFEPHGVTFAKPLVLEQQLRGTARRQEGGEAPALEGGYFADASQLDDAGGVAQLEEFRPAQVSRDGSRVRFEVHHFSGYVIATARR